MNILEHLTRVAFKMHSGFFKHYTALKPRFFLHSAGFIISSLGLLNAVVRFQVGGVEHVKAVVDLNSAFLLSIICQPFEFAIDVNDAI